MGLHIIRDIETVFTHMVGIGGLSDERQPLVYVVETFTNQNTILVEVDIDKKLFVKGHTSPEQCSNFVAKALQTRLPLCAVLVHVRMSGKIEWEEMYSAGQMTPEHAKVS